MALKKKARQQKSFSLFPPLLFFLDPGRKKDRIQAPRLTSRSETLHSPCFFKLLKMNYFFIHAENFFADYGRVCSKG
jgi:hypothetical protein